MNEYTINEIKIGTRAAFTKTITQEMEDTFRVISGDENPLHKDDMFANEISGGKFSGHAVECLQLLSIQRWQVCICLGSTA